MTPGEGPDDPEPANPRQLPRPEPDQPDEPPETPERDPQPRRLEIAAETLIIQLDQGVGRVWWAEGDDEGRPELVLILDCGFLPNEQTQLDALIAMLDLTLRKLRELPEDFWPSF